MANNGDVSMILEHVPELAGPSPMPCRSKRSTPRTWRTRWRGSCPTRPVTSPARWFLSTRATSTTADLGASRRAQQPRTDPPARRRGSRSSGTRPRGARWHRLVLVTWAELDRRSSQLAGAFIEEHGVGSRRPAGDRPAQLARASSSACWRRGSSAPCRCRCGGTCPTGSASVCARSSTRGVISATTTSPWIDATADARGRPSCPTWSSPHDQRHLQQRLDRHAEGDPHRRAGGLQRRCSARRWPSTWTPCPPAGRAGAGADVPHQRLRDAVQPARRRPVRGAGEVRRGAGRRR